MLSSDGRTVLIVHAENAITRGHLHDGASLAHLRDIPLPGVGTGFGLPLVARPHLSADGRSALLTFTTTDTPLHPLRVDIGGTMAPAPLLPIDQVVEPELSRPSSRQSPPSTASGSPTFLYKPAVENPPVVVVVARRPGGAFCASIRPLHHPARFRRHRCRRPECARLGGLGRRFVSLDDRRLRLNSVRDLAAVHASLAQRAVDATRVAVIGGSYGGYMTLAALAFYPDLWAAGIATVGISSLVTFLENTSPYRRRVREVEYGFLDTDREFLVEASPMTHVDAIRAPLMLIHGANDPRVPVGEARQLHASLVARGVQSELLIYEDEGHGLAKRVNRLDALPRMLAFLRKNLNI